MIETEPQTGIKLKGDSPYHAHLGELCGAYCEEFGGSRMEATVAPLTSMVKL